MTGDTAKNELLKAIKEIINKEPEIDYVAVDNTTEFRRSFPDLSVINMEIETEG